MFIPVYIQFEKDCSGKLEGTQVTMGNKTITDIISDNKHMLLEYGALKGPLNTLGVRGKVVRHSRV